MKMDKYDIVLDIIGHPEKYSEEQLEDMLSDSETKEIYNLLCMTASAVKSKKKIDVDAQWHEFSKRHIRKPRYMFWFGSRAASIAALVTTSMVAIAIGVMVSVSISERKAETDIAKSSNDITMKVDTTTDTAAVERDSIPVFTSPMMFEDAPLQTIMEEIAKAYDVEVKFNNKEAAGLHLYYKLNPALPLDEIIKQLNTFEQINIARKGNTLSIN